MLKAQPRGATPRLRSGAEAGRTPCPKGGGQEELPDIRGQGKRPRAPDCDSTGTAERSYPTSEAGGGGREKIPSVRGQGRWLGGPTPGPRSRGCAGAGGPRGAIPHWKGGGEEIPLVQGKEQWLRFAGAAVKRYPMSKVRETQVRR